MLIFMCAVQMPFEMIRSKQVPTLQRWRSGFDAVPTSLVPQRIDRNGRVGEGIHIPEKVTWNWKITENCKGKSCFINPH